MQPIQPTVSFISHFQVQSEYYEENMVLTTWISSLPKFVWIKGTGPYIK